MRREGTEGGGGRTTAQRARQCRGEGNGRKDRSPEQGARGKGGGGPCEGGSAAWQSKAEAPHYLEVGALVPVLLHEPQLGLLAVHLIL